jgi:F0F1-type ATP synthase membrane subunit b/b'
MPRQYIRRKVVDATEGTKKVVKRRAKASLAEGIETARKHSTKALGELKTEAKSAFSDVLDNPSQAKQRVKRAYNRSKDIVKTNAMNALGETKTKVRRNVKGGVQELAGKATHEILPNIIPKQKRKYVKKAVSDKVSTTFDKIVPGAPKRARGRPRRIVA